MAEGARAGEQPAARIWAEACEALACGIVSIANLLEPEVVVIGGGVSRAGEQLLGPVRELVGSQAIGHPARRLEIAPPRSATRSASSGPLQSRTSGLPEADVRG